MPGIVVNSSKLELLNNIISTYLNGGLLHLFGNNVTIGPTTVLGGLVELGGGNAGYAAITLNTWSSPVLGSDNFYSTSDGVVNFTNSGGSAWATAYWWFITDSTGLILLSAGNFTPTIALPALQSLPITPVWADGSEY